MSTFQFNLDNYLKAKRTEVDDKLRSFLPQSEENTRIELAMRYSLMAGGKRLRPILCLAAAESDGQQSDDILHVACCLEVLHTYSLIHDDLPAMDDDGMRRGKPTCHKAFDEATAILAGDALLTVTFELLTNQALKSKSNAFIWLQIIQEISKSIGMHGMIQGQMLDMASENHNLPIEALETLHSLKTGALISVSVRCGAILAGLSPQKRSFLEDYSRYIGLAFQISDDILNVIGDPKKMGKSVGSDQERNKNTYPALLGLEGSKRLAEKLINNALQALKSFDNKADPLRALARYVIERQR